MKYGKWSMNYYVRVYDIESDRVGFEYWLCSLCFITLH